MRWSLFLLLLLAEPAAADPSAIEQLAPSQAELEEALGSAQSAGGRSVALGEAALLLQNALGEARAEHRRLPVCENVEITSLVARARVFGAAWRDGAQRLRVEALRVERMAARGTATLPSAQVGAITQLAEEQGRAVAVASAWHGTFIETSFKECAPQIEPTAGLPRPVRAAGEPAGEVAVIVTGGGFLCPGLVPADGRVAVVAPMGCLSRSACSCEPRLILPASVLGPPQSD